MTNGSSPITEKRLTLKSVKNATYKFMRILSGNKNQFKKPSIYIPIIDQQNTFFDQRSSLQNDFCRSDSITIFDPSPRKKNTPTYSNPKQAFSGKLLVLMGDPIEKRRIVNKLHKHNFHEITLPTYIKKAARYLFKMAEKEYANQESDSQNYLETNIKQKYIQSSDSIVNDAVNIADNDNTELFGMNHIYHVNDFIEKVKSYGSRNVVVTNVENLYEHNLLKNFFAKTYKIMHLQKEVKNSLSSSQEYIEKIQENKEENKMSDSSSSDKSNERKSPKSSEARRTFLKTATYNITQQRNSLSSHSSTSFENLQNINFHLTIKKDNESDNELDNESNIFQYKNDEETIEKIINLWGDRNDINQISQV